MDFLKLIVRIYNNFVNKLELSFSDKINYNRL